MDKDITAGEDVGAGTRHDCQGTKIQDVRIFRTPDGILYLPKEPDSELLRLGDGVFLQ